MSLGKSVAFGWKVWRTRAVVVLVAAATLMVLVTVFQELRQPQPSRADSNSAQRPSAAPARPSEMVIKPRPSGLDSSLSELPQPLHLVATRVGSNAINGYADIGVDAMSPQTYRAGARLVNGATVEEIYTDRVILARDGQRKVLYLDGLPQSAIGDSSPLHGDLAFVGGGLANPVPAENAPSDALTSVLRISPRYDGEELKGLQVYAGVRIDTFEALGLKPGDVITSVDGQRVTDVEAALSALAELPKGRAMSVTVEREGVSQAVSLDGSRVMSGI